MGSGNRIFNISENRIKISIGSARLMQIRYIFFLCPHDNCKRNKETIIESTAPKTSNAMTENNKIFTLEDINSFQYPIEQKVKTKYKNSQSQKLADKTDEKSVTNSQ